MNKRLSECRTSKSALFRCSFFRSPTVLVGLNKLDSGRLKFLEAKTFGQFTFIKYYIVKKIWVALFSILSSRQRNKVNYFFASKSFVCSLTLSILSFGLKHSIAFYKLFLFATSFLTVGHSTQNSN